MGEFETAKLRRPGCRFCGAPEGSEGEMQYTNGQRVVQCARCGRFLYCQPKSEAGAKPGGGRRMGSKPDYKERGGGTWISTAKPFDAWMRDLVSVTEEHGKFGKKTVYSFIAEDGFHQPDGEKQALVPGALYKLNGTAVINNRMQGAKIGTGGRIVWDGETVPSDYGNDAKLVRVFGFNGDGQQAETEEEGVI